MPSRALGPPSDACVFVFLHRDRAETILDYKRFTIEFLPEEFLHPQFFFLRPDGTEIDETLRNEHHAYAASQIVKILETRIWPVTGKGLTPKLRDKAEQDLAKAKEALDAGKLDVAERALAPVLKLKPACGVKDRAAMLSDEIRARGELAAAWNELAATLTDPPAEVAGAIATGDWMGARKTLLRRGAEARGLVGRIEEAVRKQFAVDEAHYQLIIAQDRGHHYLEVSFRTGPPIVESLTLEISALSQKGEVFEGHTLLHNLPPSSRHMACATLSSMALRGNLVQSFRARLYLGDLLVGEKIADGAPAAWPEPPARDVKTGPDFFQPGDAYHTSSEVVPEEIRVGRVS
jgi:hypothetical protein